MKSLLFIVISSLSFTAFAVPVEGNLTYKLPTGELVYRAVTLDVPKKGQGEVTLTGVNFEWKSKLFKSFTSKDQQFFTVAFQNEFMNKKTTVVLKGTYLKGTDRIIYYGDMYKIGGHVPLVESLLGYKYIGAFNFAYTR